MTNKAYIIKRPSQLWWIKEEIIPVNVVGFIGDNITVRVNFRNGNHKSYQYQRQDIGHTIFETREAAEKALLGA